MPMSRAFTSERDGWCFCKLKMDECMFAGADGRCTLSKCKFGLKQDEPKEKSQTDQSKA
jgi:hypothetical protein